MQVKQTSKPRSTFDGKAKTFSVKLCKCTNPECPYYKKRHRRYVWVSQTKMAKPSCPKCFSHNTEIVETVEI